MMGPQAALTLMTLLLIQAAEDSQQTPVTVADVGHNVTFQCRPVNNQPTTSFYWNKQALGYLPQIVAEVVFGKPALTEQFKDSRFSTGKAEDLVFLTITNVTKEDEATYFCQSRATYGETFINGTFLSVNDRNLQSHVYVMQHPETESVHQGDSVTLQCSLVPTSRDEAAQCPSEHSVYWFRAGPGGISPGLVVAHSSDTRGETSCVYSLSKTIQDPSDAGTYYCAVATCGRILFGEGTTVETTQSLVAVLWGLFACCGAVITALIWVIRQRTGCVCAGSRGESCHVDHNISAADQSNDLVSEATYYAVLDFSARGGKKGTMKALPQESLYSGVRAEHREQR